MKENNLASLKSDANFELVDADLSADNLDPLLQEVDYVFHQAAQAGVRASWGDSFTIYTTNNILATQRLLEAAKNVHLSKLVYASSSSVYGEAEELPIRENTLPSPISPYGVSKLAGEHLCRLYYVNYNIPTISLRYFTVYGPRQRPDMAFHRFINAILCHRSISVYGDGEQTRDFTYIDDAVSANLQAMRVEAEGVSLNIGGGSRVTVNQVLHLLEDALGEEAKVSYESPKRGDVRHTFADTTAARNLLGFVPQVTLAEGLREQAKWQKRAKTWMT
jgi:UDP-glucose 4-epimerase